MDVPENVAARLRELPDKPGCYLMRDRRGAIIYIGKAVSLRKRVRSYFRAGTLRRADPKLRGLVRAVADIDWIVQRSEAHAVIAEGQLIKEYKPRYNVDFKDDKRFPLLRLDVDQPFPKLTLCRFRREDGAQYFGPYRASRAARVAHEFVEKTFGLRRCRPRIPGPDNYRHCIDDIVRFCSAPCIGRVTAAEYRERVQEAAAFLRGERPEYLKTLRAEMEQAGAERDYERAAALRDTLLPLTAAVKERAIRAGGMTHASMDVAAGAAALRVILRLAHDPRSIEAYDISNISGTYAVGAMVCARDGVPQRNRYRRFRIRTVEGSDDPAMMAEMLNRRFERLRREDGAPPDLVLIDGGLTQLRAVRRALDDGGWRAVPVAALAKRFEELYVTDHEKPVRLPADSPALRILRVLRDESHRFALAYHRRLRGQRIRESALDQIPGIGSDRKLALLQAFGSVRRLEQASEMELAAVPGVGPKTAALVYGWLHPSIERR